MISGAALLALVVGDDGRGRRVRGVGGVDGAVAEGVRAAVAGGAGAGGADEDAEVVALGLHVGGGAASSAVSETSVVVGDLSQLSVTVSVGVTSTSWPLAGQICDGLRATVSQRRQHRRA